MSIRNCVEANATQRIITKIYEKRKMNYAYIYIYIANSFVSNNIFHDLLNNIIQI